MATIQTKPQAEHFLPDFARRQWVSAKARRLWEPRVTSIGERFEAAERASVEAGLRSAALQSISPELLAEFACRATERGLVAVPLAPQGRPESYAASTAAKPQSGPWDYRVVLTGLRDARGVVRAWRTSDDEVLGGLLGYPECCRRFFAETWGAGSVDPTWAMAEHGDGPLEANILLRWLGVRYVPHLPCGFRCEPTRELGRQFRALIDARERDWMDELLAMPMRWSSLNGVGEVVTPLVTLNFRSDVTYELREIARKGTSYPEAGAHGLRFPYRPPPARRADERLWTDNGFPSLEAMEAAHRVVTSLFAPQPRRVLDLGCGNGLLARKLAGAGGKAFGVELDEGRAKRALQLRYLDEVEHGELFAVDWSRWEAELVLLMPGRLMEHLARERAELAGRLRAATTGQLVVYAYGDWLAKYGSLEKLCRAAGMKGALSEQARGDEAAAGVWEWA